MLYSRLTPTTTRSPDTLLIMTLGKWALVRNHPLRCCMKHFKGRSQCLVILIYYSYSSVPQMTCVLKLCRKSHSRVPLSFHTFVSWWCLEMIFLCCISVCSLNLDVFFFLWGRKDGSNPITVSSASILICCAGAIQKEWARFLFK